MTGQTVTKGTAPSLSVSYDPATNRQTGECADANGNLNSASPCYGTTSVYYDVENRLVRNSGTLAWAYTYAPGNSGCGGSTERQRKRSKVDLLQCGGAKLATSSSVYTGQA